MSTEAFLRSFKRFTARRGVPAKVISDNAKTFISAAKKLCALFDLPEVKCYLSSKKNRKSNGALTEKRLPGGEAFSNDW
jgi:hypothetical protein